MVAKASTKPQSLPHAHPHPRSPSPRYASKPQSSGGVPRKYKQCLRPYPDKLSDEIRRSGHWSDCDALVELWRSSSQGRTADLFVDAGANIGSCSLLMLAEGARTVAFEPLPANLFYFTSAILSNSMAFRRRLTLYPVGLGEAAAAATPLPRLGSASKKIGCF